MNIPQIAQAMAGNITFGELPDYNYIITNINNHLPANLHITQETTGSTFLEVFSQQSAEVKNKIASIIDHDVALRCEIVTDLTLRNMASDRLESDAKKNNQLVYGVVLLLVLALSLYSAYGYHLEAVKVLGVDYSSATMSILGMLYNHIQPLLDIFH